MWEGKDKENGRDCVILYEGGMGNVERMKGRKERKPAFPYLFTFRFPEVSASRGHQSRVSLMMDTMNTCPELVPILRTRPPPPLATLINSTPLLQIAFRHTQNRKYAHKTDNTPPSL